jgi:hypothetical protein
MTEKTIFIGIPLHNGLIHRNCVAGMLNTQIAFQGKCDFHTIVGSILPRNRDVLTSKFLDSPATHMLCVDSDIGFTPNDVHALLDSNVDFVSGCYPKKQPNREIPAKLNGKSGNGLLGAEWAPAGFMLLSRECVERMIGAYRKWEYITEFGRCWGLWSPTFGPGQPYVGEDVAFCNRWTEIGGSIWIHPGVLLSHAGDHTYSADADKLQFSL